MNFKSIGIPTIKLLVIAAVITILLFLTNNTTEAKIAQNQADANVASRKEVLPDADDFDEKTVTVDGVDIMKPRMAQVMYSQVPIKVTAVL